MAKIIKRTDLTKTDPEPTPRADVPLEKFQVCARWLGGKVNIKTRTYRRSLLGSAIATLLLILGGCAAAVTLAGIGAPLWVAVGGGLASPVIFYCLFRRGGTGTSRLGGH